jgi:hypothetical protein
MNNEKAFPNPHLRSDDGITVRDYFAARAMQAQVSVPETLIALGKKTITADQVCGSCYEWADSMLRAREQK